ncbi:MAG: SRPBCC domain-containing protein [Pseudomonadales bacterium]|nr:SRPBCC domain-containing protein [Pseudomonadales bacterium]
MNELTVNITKVVKAPITTVFDAWLDPKMLAQFMRPSPEMTLSPTTNEAVVDGQFEILMQVGEKTIPHSGQYLEIERPNKLVFTWISPASTDDSVVTLSFKTVEQGHTELNLSHVRFVNEERRSDHEGGWGRIIDCLIELLD